MQRNTKLNVLALQLSSGIWAHTSQEARILEALDPLKHCIYLVSCGGIQSTGCIVRESKNRSLAPRLKEFDCKRCNLANGQVERHLTRLGFKTNLVRLSDWTHEEDRLLASSLIPSEWDEDQVRQIELLGLPVGKTAFYEWYLNSKSTSLTSPGLSQERLDRRSHSLVNVCMVMLAFNRYLESQVAPKFDVVLTYAPQYSINNSALKVLEKYQPQVRQYFVEGSFHPEQKYKSVQIWDWKKFGLAPPDHPRPRQLKLKEESLTAFESEYLEALAKSESFMVYSKPDTHSKKENIISTIGFESKERIFLVALSSVDEVSAAAEIGAMDSETYPGTVFASQFEMFEFLTNYAESHKEIGFVLRLHPREFSEARNRNSSESLNRWLGLIESAKGSIYLNTPSDPWSVGDLIKVSDKVITGWSSVAVQSVLLGVHTVTYDANMGFFDRRTVSSGLKPEDLTKNLSLTPSKSDLQMRRLLAQEWLWMNFIEAEIEAPSATRLALDFIRRNGLVRKGFYVLEELLPRTMMGLDLSRAPHTSEQTSGRVQSLVNDQLAFPPYKSLSGD